MRFDSLVLQEQRHLKWRALDPLEHAPDDPVRRRHHRLQRCWSWRRHHPHHRRSLALAPGSDDDLLHLRHLHRRRRGDAPQRPSLSRGARGIDDRQQAAVLRDVQPAGRARRRALHDLFRLSELSRRLQEPAHAVDDAAGDALYAAIPLCGALVALFTDRADGQRLAQRLCQTVQSARRERGNRCDDQRRAHRPDGLSVPVPRLSWACRWPSR